jgi:hypothetical protein
MLHHKSGAIKSVGELNSQALFINTLEVCNICHLQVHHKLVVHKYFSIHARREAERDKYCLSNFA